MVYKHCKLIFKSVEYTSLNQKHHLHDYYMDTKSIGRDSIKGQDDGGAVESLAFVGGSNLVATSLLKSLIESSMA